MSPGARGSLRQWGFSPGPPRVPRPPRLPCTGAGVGGKGVRSADEAVLLRFAGAAQGRGAARFRRQDPGAPVKAPGSGEQGGRAHPRLKLVGQRGSVWVSEAKGK